MFGQGIGERDEDGGLNRWAYGKTRKPYKRQSPSFTRPPANSQPVLRPVLRPQDAPQKKD